jgi:hypothetical protein
MEWEIAAIQSRAPVELLAYLSLGGFTLRGSVPLAELRCDVPVPPLHYFRSQDWRSGKMWHPGQAEKSAAFFEIVPDGAADLSFCF